MSVKSGSTGSRAGSSSLAFMGAKRQHPAIRAAIVEPMEDRTLMSVSAGYTETTFAGGGGALRWSAAMDFAPDGRLFVAEQYDGRVNAGSLRLVKNGQLTAKPVLTLPVSRGFERGLVGVLADKNFNTTHQIYVYWTANSTPGHNYAHNVISRFTLNGDVADPASRVDIFEQAPLESEYHNGGSMHWGPDGKLYVGVGDNAIRANAQSLNTTKGKILRLNPDGTIPTDNPFYNQTSGINRAIYALGFRNPFTFTFAPDNTMYVNDVGLDTWEEVDIGVRGGNYGWATIEGKRTNQTPPANYHDPIYTYKHPTNGFAAITGSIYWNGAYYFGDYVSGVISRLDPMTHAVTPFANVTQPTDIDIGPDGAMYIASNGSDAKIFRIAKTGSQAPGITTQPASQKVAAGTKVTFNVTAFGANLSYQWQKNDQDIQGATGTSFTINSAGLGDNGDKYRVIVTNNAGTATSLEATLNVVNDTAPTAVINTPAAGFIWKAGTTLNFSGDGTDAEDGTLPNSAFTWSVDYFTGTAQRPLYLQNTGIRGDSIAIPAITPYTGPDVFLRITLTTTDSLGISTTVTRDVFPQTSHETVQTSVPGLKLFLDNTQFNTTQHFTGVVGVQRNLSVPQTQTLNGKTYQFTGWSDGGAIAHNIATPAVDTTYTANYKLVSGTGTGSTLNAVADTYFRDGPNAGVQYGTQTQLQSSYGGATSTNRKAVIKFDISQLTTINNVKLRLFGGLNRAATKASEKQLWVGIYNAANGWTESSTWNTQPKSGTRAAEGYLSTGAAKWYEFDVTAAVKAAKANGQSFITFSIQAAPNSVFAVFNSREAAANKPQLAVS